MRTSIYIHSLLKADEPCSKWFCANLAECAKQKIACLVFDQYVLTGRGINPRSCGIKGIPNKQIYIQLFPGELNESNR